MSWWRQQHSLVPLRSTDKLGSSLPLWKTKLGGKRLSSKRPGIKEVGNAKTGTPKILLPKKNDKAEKLMAEKETTNV